MTVSCQSAACAIWAQVPSRSPFARGRPRFPVRGGLGPYSTALAGSLVVQVVPSTIRDSPWKAASPVPCSARPGNAPASSFIISAASSTWEAVPLPRHSRNSTGSATGEGQNGSRHTIAATTQVFPNAIFLPPCADPSYAHRAWNTFIWSPNLGVFAVSAAGVLCAFSCVVDALPGQCLRRRPGTHPLVAAVFRTKRLLRERCSGTCQCRRRPGQARHRQGQLQITADLYALSMERGHVGGRPLLGYLR